MADLSLLVFACGLGRRCSCNMYRDASTYMFICVYFHVYVLVYIHISIYIYMYIYIEREREKTVVYV